jgi:3-hydroxyisobutyrate dehydrogenase-like beta-hydroxyacid dehydrogenase
MSKAKVAFIGLGVMGYPMAGHLANAGYQTCVYNRTSSKAEKWCEEYSGSFATTPREASADADFVFVCVGNDDDLRSVIYGDDGVLAGIKADAILVDHTTASADVAREIAEKASVQFLDAPVSGGQAGAENGVLTVMMGGDQAAFDSAKPVIMSYARAAELLGPVGSGQLTKMVNQICIAGLVQGLSEGLNFAQKAGLDGAKVVDVISKGAAGSWQMENRGLTMLKDEFEFGFAVDWMRKDLGICIEESNKNGAQLPITKIVNDYYGEVQEMGGGRWDTSSLLRRLTK